MNANSTNRTTCRAISALLALAALLWLPATAGAGQYSLFKGDVIAVTKTTVAFGVAFRNGNADCQLIGAGAGQGDDPEFPCASGAVAVNDDPNINFKKGDALSAPITVVSDFTFRHKSGTGVFFRLRGWYDTVLDNKKMPHGTTSTAFVPDTKMDDSGYIGAQKFKGFELYDAFFFGNYKLDKSTLTLRVGRQAIDWGESVLYPGVNGIQAYDFAWATMPGAPSINGAKLPVNRVVVSLAGGEGWTVDGFMNLEFRESVLPGCGTWNSYNDQGPAPGCNLAAAGGFPDRFSALVLKNRSYYEGRLFAGGAFPEGGIATAAGTYREPSQWSGYGMAVHKFANALNTDFGFYYANYTNPILNISPLVGTDALTFAVNTHFVPDVQILGVSTSTGVRNIAMFGQLLYTLDYPAQRNAPTFIQGSTQGLGPYGWMQSHVNEQVPAFFEMDVAQLQLGGTWQFGERIGLTDATLTGEVNGQWATNHPGLEWAERRAAGPFRQLRDRRLGPAGLRLRPQSARQRDHQPVRGQGLRDRVRGGLQAPGGGEPAAAVAGHHLDSGSHPAGRRLRFLDRRRGARRAARARRVPPGLAAREVLLRRRPYPAQPRCGMGRRLRSRPVLDGVRNDAVRRMR